MVLEGEHTFSEWLKIVSEPKIYNPSEEQKLSAQEKIRIMEVLRRKIKSKKITEFEIA